MYHILTQRADESLLFGYTTLFGTQHVGWDDSDQCLASEYSNCCVVCHTLWLVVSVRSAARWPGTPDIIASGAVTATPKTRKVPTHSVPFVN